MSSLLNPVSNPKSKRVPMLAVAASLMLVAALVTGFNSSVEEMDSDTHCLIDQAPPASRVIAIDTTDRLLIEQKSSVERSVQQLLDQTQPFERLVLMAIDDDANTENTLVDACIPELNSNAARISLRDKLLSPIQDGIDQLENREASEETLIIETLAAIADRQDWRDRDDQISVTLYTDAMQNSALQSFYEPADSIRSDKAILSGMHITIVPLKNERDYERQHFAFKQLEKSLSDLGAASVSLEVPGWLALSEI